MRITTLLACHTIMQVPQLRLAAGLVLPRCPRQPTGQQVQARTQELRQAAELLAAVPGLALGREPAIGRINAKKNSWVISCWSEGEELAIACVLALQPLASCLERVGLSNRLLSTFVINGGHGGFCGTSFCPHTCQCTSAFFLCCRPAWQLSS